MITKYHRLVWYCLANSLLSLCNYLLRFFFFNLSMQNSLGKKLFFSFSKNSSLISSRKHSNYTFAPYTYYIPVSLLVKVTTELQVTKILWSGPCPILLDQPTSLTQGITFFSLKYFFLLDFYFVFVFLLLKYLDEISFLFWSLFPRPPHFKVCSSTNSFPLTFTL